MQLDIKSFGFLKQHFKFRDGELECYHAIRSINIDKLWTLYDSTTNELKLTISKKLFFLKRPSYRITLNDELLTSIEFVYNKATDGYKGLLHGNKIFLVKYDIGGTTVLENEVSIGGWKTISWGIWRYKDVINIINLSYKELIVAFYLVFNDMQNDN